MTLNWYFYPFPCVIEDIHSLPKQDQVIISAPDGFSGFNGITVKTLRNWIKNNPEQIIP